MKVIRFLEAQDDLRKILDSVNDSDDVVTLRRSDTDDAVIMSLKHYESLIETLYLLKSPANVAHLAESIDQAKSGKTVVHEISDISN